MSIGRVFIIVLICVHKWVYNWLGMEQLGMEQSSGTIKWFIAVIANFVFSIAFSDLWQWQYLFSDWYVTKVHTRIYGTLVYIAIHGIHLKTIRSYLVIMV